MGIIVLFSPRDVAVKRGAVDPRFDMPPRRLLGSCPPPRRRLKDAPCGPLPAKGDICPRIRAAACEPSSCTWWSTRKRSLPRSTSPTDPASPSRHG